MRPETLHDEGILVVHDFFTADECSHAITRSEAAGFGDAPINAGLAGQVIRKDVRNNERVMIDDVAFARELWDRVKPFIPSVRELGLGNWLPIGLNERLRFYRYDPGQQFHWHYDGRFTRDNGEESLFTFMVYLNGDFEGGATEFNPRRSGLALLDTPLLTVVPEMGMALLFRHDVLHQGATVTRGRKYVLRSDVMFRRSE